MATPTATPIIPDLLDGAEIFGLLTALEARSGVFDLVTSSPDSGAFAAAFQKDIGPVGYDDVFAASTVVHAQPDRHAPPSDPLIGIDPTRAEAAFAASLAVAGWMRDPAQDGAGDELLLNLDGYSVWAALVPEQDNLVNFAANGRSAVFVSAGGTDSREYLVVPVPVPASVFMLQA